MGGVLGPFTFWKKCYTFLKNVYATAEVRLMYRVHADESYTMVSLSSDDHIVIETPQKNIGINYDTFSSKYETKRLGFPKKLFEWQA